MKIFLGALLFIITLSSCQPAADNESTPSPKPTSDTTTPSSSEGRRYDQSPILPVDTRVSNAGTRLNRSIPDMDDTSITYCESVNGEIGKYNGVRDTQKYPLASLSKIFLSAWALDKLGPNYQFENLWHLKKVSEGVYDAYFRAHYDPALNIEKMLYAMSMLNAQGVRKIRQLVIDETTRVYLSVLLEPHVELEEVPVSVNKSVENLKIILNSQRWGSQTEAAKNNLSRFAQLQNRTIQLPKYFAVDQVTYTEAKNINVKNYTSVVKVKSAILTKYLKDINVTSNNYMSDMLFKTLGGQSAFKTFQLNRLNISADDLQFYTGSGLPINGLSVRVDNMATCLSVLKTLKFIKGLSRQLNFNLGHVLLTAGVDQGTYDPTQVIDFKQSVALKTGRLFDVPTLNVAGVANLGLEGSLFFSFMAHDFDNNDEWTYKNKRDRILKSILNFYPVKPSYQTMAIDGILIGL